MPYYVVPGVATCSAAFNQQATSVYAASTNAPLRRGKAYEVIMGTTSNPNTTDCVVQFDLSRMSATTGLSGTSYAPNVLDPADPAVPSALAFITASGATITAASNLLPVPLNQRNTQRWQAAQESQMIVWPATAGNGLVARALSPTYGAQYQASISFME